jgi:galactokinase
MNAHHANHPAVRASRAAYSSAFGSTASHLAWAPGRINLIGEHTDYNDGFVLPVALDRLVALAGSPRADRVVRLFAEHQQEVASFSLEGLTPATSAERGGRLPLWARYPLGVAAELRGLGHQLVGVDAAIAGNVPLGAGMSSSAALEVASGNLFTALAGVTLEPLALARLCQQAEQHTVGVRVGILDQAASCLGRQGQALLLDCRSLRYEHLPFALPDVALLICDTGVRRELATSAYNERRSQCEQATALLADLLAAEGHQGAIAALRDVSLDDLARHAAAMPEVLRRRARHVIGENARVMQAVAALCAADLATLGALLFASHTSLRDDYEVSCLELDSIVNLTRRVPGVLGSRLIGAGFGGCVLVLGKRDILEPVQTTLAHDYPLLTGRQASVYECISGDGPGTITVSDH